MSTHHWITADRSRDRDRAVAALGLPGKLAVVSAHRRLRGPYTAAGSVLRAIGTDLLARCPGLGPRHRVEIAETTPELAGYVPPVPWTLDHVVSSDERRRFPARMHTTRLSHGLVELLRDYLIALGDGPRALVVHDVTEADHTDQEFLAVLLRRVPPELLTVVICTGPGPWVELPGPLHEPLGASLAAHTVRVDAPSANEPDPVGGSARSYVDSECLADDPVARDAYLRMDVVDRQALHDRRAAELVAVGEPSLLLGAVPFHLEHGGDPAGAGADALRAAQTRCRNLGFYRIAAEFGARGRALLDPERDWARWWALTGGMTMALASCGLAAEAKAFHDEVRRISHDPEVHMHLAYATGLLYTRHFAEPERDHDAARAWLNLSIAIAALLPDPAERTFYSVFNRNGLALVEVRQGRPDEAVRLVTEGLDRLDRELDPEAHLQHRSGLRYNRAQVHMMVGRLDDAVADLTASMDRDSHFADHYFNRAGVLRRLGRTGEAIADYDRALELSPPFEEAFFNRGAARVDVGDLDGAASDFGRAVELNPAHLDARLNLASVLLDLGDPGRAAAEVRAGLSADPAHPHLLCLSGRLSAEAGDLTAAEATLTEALRHAPGLAEAWALRGEVAFAAGELAVARAHLDRAAELDPTLPVLYNRAVVARAEGRFADAVADLDRALGLADDDEVRELRETCAAEMS